MRKEKKTPKKPPEKKKKTNKETLRQFISTRIILSLCIPLFALRPVRVFALHDRALTSTCFCLVESAPRLLIVELCTRKVPLVLNYAAVGDNSRVLDHPPRVQVTPQPPVPVLGLLGAHLG